MNNDSIELNLRRGKVPYFNLRNKLEQKIKIKKKLDQFNTYLNTFGLCFSKIDIVTIQTTNPMHAISMVAVEANFFILCKLMYIFLYVKRPNLHVLKFSKEKKNSL